MGVRSRRRQRRADPGAARDHTTAHGLVSDNTSAIVNPKPTTKPPRFQVLHIPLNTSHPFKSTVSANLPQSFFSKTTQIHSILKSTLYLLLLFFLNFFSSPDRVFSHPRSVQVFSLNVVTGLPFYHRLSEDQGPPPRCGSNQAAIFFRTLIWDLEGIWKEVFYPSPPAPGLVWVNLVRANHMGGSRLGAAFYPPASFWSPKVCPPPRTCSDIFYPLHCTGMKWRHSAVSLPASSFPTGGRQERGCPSAPVWQRRWRRCGTTSRPTPRAPRWPGAEVSGASGGGQILHTAMFCKSVFYPNC